MRLCPGNSAMLRRHDLQIYIVTFLVQLVIAGSNSNNTHPQQPLSLCGNGVRDSTEQCDPQIIRYGARNTGCSDSCTCTSGYVALPDGFCAGPCGDGLLGPGEECDGEEAGCNRKTCQCASDYEPNPRIIGTCQLVCGNGVWDNGEECDPAVVLQGKANIGCTKKCICSNGYLALPGGFCAGPCGNGVLDLGEECDTDAPSCDAKTCQCATGYNPDPENPGKCSSRCGNGVLDGTEVCDPRITLDGVPNTGCAGCTECKRGFIATKEGFCAGPCGNRLVDPGEQCDGGLHDRSCDLLMCQCAEGYFPDPARPGTCYSPCGDGVPDKGEECDTKLDTSGLCSSSCTCAPGSLPSALVPGHCAPQSCGNGVIEGTQGEQCDPPNLAGGCSAQCTCMPGFVPSPGNSGVCNAIDCASANLFQGSCTFDPVMQTFSVASEMRTCTGLSQACNVNTTYTVYSSCACAPGATATGTDAQGAPCQICLNEMSAATSTSGMDEGDPHETTKDSDSSKLPINSKSINGAATLHLTTCGGTPMEFTAYPDGIFNLVSEHDHQVNALLCRVPDAPKGDDRIWICGLGIKYAERMTVEVLLKLDQHSKLESVKTADDTVRVVLPNYSAIVEVKINGEVAQDSVFASDTPVVVEQDTLMYFPSAHHVEDPTDGPLIVVRTPLMEMTLYMETESVAHLEIGDFKVTDELKQKLQSSKRKLHGVLGQTWYWQDGQGTLTEGSATDYAVSSLLGVDFKHNQFSQAASTQKIEASSAKDTETTKDLKQKVPQTVSKQTHRKEPSAASPAKNTKTVKDPKRKANRPAASKETKQTNQKKEEVISERATQRARDAKPEASAKQGANKAQKAPEGALLPKFASKGKTKAAVALAASLVLGSQPEDDIPEEAPEDANQSASARIVRTPESQHQEVQAGLDKGDRSNRRQTVVLPEHVQKLSDLVSSWQTEEQMDGIALKVLKILQQQSRCTSGRCTMESLDGVASTVLRSLKNQRGCVSGRCTLETLVDEVSSVRSSSQGISWFRQKLSSWRSFTGRRGLISQ